MFEIYTDGSCRGVGNNRRAGYGIIIINDEFSIYREIYGRIVSDEKVTNQIAELVAATYGLKTLMSNFPSSEYPNESVCIYTDSAYIVNCFKDKWYLKWEANGWLNANGKPVANKELWEELIKLVRFYNVTFEKVKGHSSDTLNNRCDSLAVMGANTPSEVYSEYSKSKV